MELDATPAGRRGSICSGQRPRFLATLRRMVQASDQYYSRVPASSKQKSSSSIMAMRWRTVLPPSSCNVRDAVTGAVL